MNKIKIGKKILGDGEKCFIIAEAGVNHNGKLDLAKKLVDEAVKSGADAIKFQTFKAESLVANGTRTAEYQKENIGTEKNQLEMLKELELSYENFKELKEYCDDKKIIFLSTPYDEESADFLSKIKISAFKISSSDITHFPFLEYIA